MLTFAFAAILAITFLFWHTSNIAANNNNDDGIAVTFGSFAAIGVFIDTLIMFAILGINR